MTSGRRNALVAVAVLCALALVITVVVRSHSPAHRSDAALDDIRSLPGVAEATARNYPEAGDSPRDAVVTLSRSATAAQASKVLTGAQRAADGDVIDKVSVRAGAARVEVADGSRHSARAARPLVALAGLSHGSAEVRVRSAEPAGFKVIVDPDGQQAVGTAAVVVRLLDRKDSPVGSLVVGFEDYPMVIVSGSAGPAARLLETLKSQQGQVRSVRLTPKNVVVGTGPDTSTVALHRKIASIVRSAYPGAALSIEGTADQPRLTGTGATTTITETADRLSARHLRLTRFDTSRSELGVTGEKDPLTAKDVPAVRTAIASLKPALPADCDLSIQRTAGGYEDIFDGTPAQLTRLAPKLAATAARGYEASWGGDRIEVLLPRGTDLTITTAKPAMKMARSLGWSGKRWVQIGARSANGERSKVVRFQSTATGYTDQSVGSEDQQSYASVWNSTVPSAKGAGS